jgi:hypothetical protein
MAKPNTGGIPGTSGSVGSDLHSALGAVKNTLGTVKGDLGALRGELGGLKICIPDCGQ